jgi:hypothetical protein
MAKQLCWFGYIEEQDVKRAEICGSVSVRGAVTNSADHSYTACVFDIQMFFSSCDV